MNLRYLCAQPAITYYTWQVETMLNNFVEMGINLNNVDIVCCKQDTNVPEDWSKLANKYAARFFFYQDTRTTKGYTSSIRPNILKQHWLAYPELQHEAILYHDCDIVFTHPVSEWITNEMIDDEYWYGSDTRWYIGHDYILSKGDDILSAMCEIAQIDKELVKENEFNSIGAQYIMKGLTSAYWENIESISERLFVDINKLNNQKKELDPAYHEVQIWCADMWAVLWEGWKLGYKTKCHNNFQFGWATSLEEDWNKFNIFHNAGVVNSQEGLFYKGEYINELPYNKPLQIKAGTASWHYWNEVQKTAKKSVLI